MTLVAALAVVAIVIIVPLVMLPHRDEFTEASRRQRALNRLQEDYERDHPAGSENDGGRSIGRPQHPDDDRVGHVRIQEGLSDDSERTETIEPALTVEHETA